jgi:prepilin-type N-terminal cleavage/methylation domain-containing protein
MLSPDDFNREDRFLMIENVGGSADENGFTLVELLVVIVILGILAAIVVFAVGGITDRGQTSANGTDVTNLQVAEEAYFARQDVNGPYATETSLLAGSYLRSLSTLNYLCIRSDTGSGDWIPDYFVHAGSPVGTALVNIECARAATQDEQPNKPGDSVWTASSGAGLFP